MSEKTIEKVSFGRKDKRPGTYTTNLNGKEIALTNMQTYVTDNPDEIKFFDADPEIIRIKADKAKKEK